MRIKLPAGVRFWGLNSCSLEFKPKELLAPSCAVIRRTIAEYIRSVPTAGLMFQVSRNDSPQAQELYLAYRHDRRGIFIVHKHGASWDTPAEPTKALEDLFIALKADIEIESTGTGIKFHPPTGTEIEVRLKRDDDQPTMIEIRIQERFPGEWLENLVFLLSDKRFKIKSSELFLSFSFADGQSEAEALKEVEAVNGLRLPTQTAKCVVNCTVASMEEVGALLEVKKLDCEGLSINHALATFTTPAGIPGCIVAIAEKTGLVTELHAGQAYDEQAFVKELKALFKEQLRNSAAPTTLPESEILEKSLWLGPSETTPVHKTE